MICHKPACTVIGRILTLTYYSSCNSLQQDKQRQEVKSPVDRGRTVHAPLSESFVREYRSKDDHSRDL